MNEIAPTLEEIMGMSNLDYEAFLSKILDDVEGASMLDDLDDKLVDIVREQPARVEEICRINLSTFSELPESHARTSLIGYNYNTLLLACIYQNKFELAKSVFHDGLRFCGDEQHFHAGKSLSQNIFHLFDLGALPEEEALYFLPLIAEFYTKVERIDEAINAICTAASAFGDARAFQSAYRALGQAAEIAHSHPGMPRNMAKVLATQGEVALIEGDLDCAEVEFQKCFEIYAVTKEKPPIILSINAALVKLRRGKVSEAKAIYEQIISEKLTDEEASLQSQARINLLICYRELNMLPELHQLISEILEDLNIYSHEQILELRLVLAKTYFKIGDVQSGEENLIAACTDIQSLIDTFQKLHYRRGVREGYVPRIKSMIGCFNPSGNSNQMLFPLSACFANSISDWFSILAWVDGVLASKKVPKSTKTELSATIKNLAQLGTPFLYGFREKYDDPFDIFSIYGESADPAESITQELQNEVDYGRPWRQFNFLASNICKKYGFTSPVAGVSVSKTVDLLKEGLSKGCAFLFAVASEKTSQLILVIEGKYHTSSLQTGDLIQFKLNLAEYQMAGPGGRKVFNNQLSTFCSLIRDACADFWRLLEDRPIEEIVLVSDFLSEGLPILPVLLENDILRQRIKDQRLVIRDCPILAKGKFQPLQNGPCLFISNSEEGLELADAEKISLKLFSSSSPFTELDLASEKANFTTPQIKNAEIIHMVTHSVPANNFTDPFFVSSSIRNSFNSIPLESIQREAQSLQAKLVFLNGCNTSVTGNRNFFKHFRTTEKVGLSSAFLLNRRSLVIASQWNVPEIAGYVFSYLFYAAMNQSNDPARAFALASVGLFEMTKSETLSLFQKIPNRTVSDRLCRNLKPAKVEFPFRSEYFLALFQLHSPLPDWTVKLAPSG